MRKLGFMLGVAALAFSLNARPAAAGLTAVPIDFVMPQGADPNFFDYSFDGQFYDITGNYLLKATAGGLGGADLRSIVPTLTFSQIKITPLDYAGGSVFSSLTPAPYNTTPYLFTPWQVSNTDIIPSGGTEFLTAFQSVDARESTQRDFAKCIEAGIRGFPTLLAGGAGDGYQILTHGFNPLATVEAALVAWAERSPG